MSQKTETFRKEVGGVSGWYVILVTDRFWPTSGSRGPFKLMRDANAEKKLWRDEIAREEAEIKADVDEEFGPGFYVPVNYVIVTKKLDHVLTVDDRNDIWNAANK